LWWLTLAITPYNRFDWLLENLLVFLFVGLLPAIGTGTSLYVGWRLERNFALSEADLSGTRVGLIWLWLVRIIVPVTILGILLEAVGVL
jgi:SNF family Na+-dependent transporter